MIGRANIEGSKSNVAMNAWLLHKPVINVGYEKLIRVGTGWGVLHKVVKWVGVRFY